MKSKKPQWDGRSRIPTKKYKEEYNRIFGKKIKKGEEVTGYYYNGYKDNAEIELLTEKKNDKKE